VRALLVAGYDPVSHQVGAITPYADDAVQNIERDLRARFSAPALRIETLTAPSVPEMNAVLVDLRGDTQSGDLFVVMFAGHGADAIGAELSEAWMLSSHQPFTDAALAHQLESLGDDVDVVVISDCCYGAGFFNIGPMKLPLHSHHLPEPTGMTDDQRIAKLHRQSQALGIRLGKLWDKLSANSGAMVCISAASASGRISSRYVLEENLPLLTAETAEAAELGHTYADLKLKFKQTQSVGCSFCLDARPVARLDDLVLSYRSAAHSTTVPRSTELPQSYHPL
jgi:hypothetical protein